MITLRKSLLFYAKQSIQEPLIVEGLKNSIERLRLAQIVASIAETEVKPSPYETVRDAVTALRKKYTDPKQWQVLWPFFKMVDASGITGILQMLPFKPTAQTPVGQSSKVTEEIIAAMEENVDELFETLCVSDIMQTYSADELLEADQVKGTQILTTATNTGVVSDRAKKLADTMIARQMFQKSMSDLTPDDKATFDETQNRRKLLVAQLAQKLLPTVKALQATP